MIDKIIDVVLDNAGPIAVVIILFLGWLGSKSNNDGSCIYSDDKCGCLSHK